MITAVRCVAIRPGIPNWGIKVRLREIPIMDVIVFSFWLILVFYDWC